MKKNPIEEYFKDTGKIEQDENLFTGDDETIDLKTELNDGEISHISIMGFNDKFLEKNGIKPLFSNYFNNFMRKKVSKNRKSRSEYVDVRKQEIINNEENKRSVI